MPVLHKTTTVGPVITLVRKGKCIYQTASTGLRLLFMAHDGNNITSKLGSDAVWMYYAYPTPLIHPLLVPWAPGLATESLFLFICAARLQTISYSLFGTVGKIRQDTFVWRKVGLICFISVCACVLIALCRRGVCVRILMRSSLTFGRFNFLSSTFFPSCWAACVETSPRGMFGNDPVGWILRERVE